MNELERYLDWVITRIAVADAREEPDLELKSSYPSKPEGAQLFELADLLASLANDVRIDGYRALIFGPAPELKRPAWLEDEAVVRDKLIRHFDGGVVPGIELLRRELNDGRVIDAFVVVDRDDTPFLTRLEPGGVWVVRVRTNTARRTATRGELVRLIKGTRPAGGPVGRIDVRLGPLGKGTQKVFVTNTGTINVREIRLEVPPEAESRAFDEDVGLDHLQPGETYGIPIMGPVRAMGRGVKSERLVVRAVADDGEQLSASVLVSNFD